jgi:hypothetical protein
MARYATTGSDGAAAIALLLVTLEAPGTEREELIQCLIGTRVWVPERDATELQLMKNMSKVTRAAVLLVRGLSKVFLQVGKLEEQP